MAHQQGFRGQCDLTSSELKAHFDFHALILSSLNVTLLAIRNAILIKTEFGAK